MLLSEMGLFALRGFDLTNPRDAQVRRALDIAHGDVGVHERPRGSNRGARIDAYNTLCGVPLGSYWCAAAAATWWKEAGLEIPPMAATWWVQHKLPVLGPASCRGWVKWGLVTARWSHTPKAGAVVIYGKNPSDLETAEHCGLVVEWDPLDGTQFSIEGNTTLDGYSRNGEVVTLKSVRTERVLGYVYPFPQ